MQVLTFREKQSLSFKDLVAYKKELKQHKKDKRYAVNAGRSVFMIILSSIVASAFVFMFLVGLVGMLFPPMIFITLPIWALVSISECVTSLGYRNRTDLV